MKRIFLLIVIVVLGTTAGALWWWTRESLPPLDGELRLRGLNAPVEVVLDLHGVPHIYAAGPEDAWFAAGVMHARDRLWQMELYRRVAYGRLSELLGEDTLPIDRRFVTLGLHAAAAAEWGVLPPEVRDALNRYAEGVNAQMRLATGRRRPLEFQILRVDPAPWTPIDSLAVGRLLSWRLAENHQAELVRHALAARFGTNEAIRLGGRYPANGPTVMQGFTAGESSAIPDGEGAMRSPGGPVAAASALRNPAMPKPSAKWPAGLEWLDPSVRRGNSNNWVIAGRRTANGRPLLANDPHLQVEMPGTWYEMHLVAAGLEVIGVTVPGAPYVVLGHNDRIAWGVTNSNADVQDLYIERIDVARRRYLYQGQWLPVEIWPVDIPVRGSSPVPFEVWRTRHGTVFAEVGLDWQEPPVWLSRDEQRSGQKRVFALRWDAIGGEIAGAFDALNRAGGWTEFLRAVERFASPSQNFVYADVEGNIGYAMSGVLPQRASGVGIMPSDGTNGEHEWIGRIDPSTLPRVLNPASGYVTSSNNQIDRQWTGLITRDWTASYRATQLHHTISTAERVDITQSARWQNDVMGLAPAHVLSVAGAALEKGRKIGADASALRVLEELIAWDKQVDGRPIVTLYHVFEDLLWRRTFFDEMGSPLFERFYEWAGEERPSGLYAILNDGTSAWFDDIGTIERRESRDDIVLLAAFEASERFQNEYGGTTPWDEAHAARFDHPIGSAAAPLGWLFNRGPSRIHGNTWTVMRVSHHRLRPFRAFEMPSWRQIFEVGAWDEARVVLPGGQSGHPLSPHYFDQNDIWRQGQYRQQPFSRERVNAAAAHRLLLLP